MLNILSTDDEKSRGNRIVVTENYIEGASNQQWSLKENGNRKTTYIQNQENTFENKTNNQERGLKS